MTVVHEDLPVDEALVHHENVLLTHLGLFQDYAKFVGIIRLGLQSYSSCQNNKSNGDMIRDMNYVYCTETVQCLRVHNSRRLLTIFFQ